MPESFWCRWECLVKWGSCYGWCSACRGFVAGRPGVLAAGMLKSRAGWLTTALPARFRVPATWIFSLHVVQAGSARGRGRRPGLPRQRSTELVRSSRRPGESCPGFLTGLVPDGLAGSLSPSSGGRSRAPAAVRADGSAGQAASGWQRGACWQAAAPEATAASQMVPWTTGSAEEKLSDRLAFAGSGWIEFHSDGPPQAARPSTELCSRLAVTSEWPSGVRMP